MRTAFLLIDIQNDYFPGGKHELHEPGPAAAQAERALALFRKRGLPVVFIQHVSLGADASFFLPDTQGVELYARLRPSGTEKTVVKHHPDSFLHTDLRETLQALNVRKLVVCGMMSHMCVDTTVRAAQGLGYRVVVLSDACAAKDLRWKDALIPAETVHRAFMASLHGTFAEVINTDDLDKALGYPAEGFA